MDNEMQGVPGPELADIDDIHFISFLQEIAHEDEPGVDELGLFGGPVPAPVIPLPASAPNTGQRAFTQDSSAALQHHPGPVESHPVPTTWATPPDEQDKQNPADAPKPAAPGPKSTLTKKQLQLEKLRAKNRRSQARYREKCKKEREALEAKLAAVRKLIDVSAANYKRLRQERSALLTRIKNANAAQAEPCAPQHTHHQHTSVRTPPAQRLAQGPLTSDLGGTPSTRLYDSLVPTRIRRQRFIDSFEEVPWPISSFRHHASVSFPEVAPFMPRSQLWFKDRNNGIYAAVTGYLESVCSDLGRHLSEICWFNQLPFQVRCGVNDSRPLAEAVAGVLKPVLREYRRRLPREKWTAVCIKAMNIVQHSIDAMQAPPASDGGKETLQPSNTICTTSDCGNAAKSAQLGQQPPPQKGQDWEISSGVNESNPDNSALEATEESDEENDQTTPENCVNALLTHAQRQRSTMSGGPKLAPASALSNSISAHISDVCQLETEVTEVYKQCVAGSLPVSLDSVEADVCRAVSGAASNADGMTAVSDTMHLPSTEDGCWTATEERALIVNGQQSMQWEELDKTMLVLMQCVMNTYASVLRETPGHDYEVETTGRTFDQIHSRMMELMASAGIACRMMHETAPVTARRMCLGKTSSASTNVQAERLQMRVFSYLQFTPQQKMELAEKWRGWHRRRNALDRQLDQALSTFNTSLPSPALITKEFQNLLDTLLESTPHTCTDHFHNTDCSDDPEGKDVHSVGIGDLHMSANGTTHIQSPSCVAEPETDGKDRGSLQHAQAQPVSDRTSTAADLGENVLGSLHAASEDTASDGDKDRKDPGLGMNEMLVLQSMYTRKAFRSIDPFILDQDEGQQTDCHVNTAQCQIDDTKGSFLHSDSTFSEAAEKLSRLLGVSGEETRKCEDSLDQVLDVHRSDGKMYYEYVSHVTMPSCLLTEVQHCKLMAAHTEIGVSVIDMLRLFQAAAHEERWDALFGGFRV